MKYVKTIEVEAEQYKFGMEDGFVAFNTAIEASSYYGEDQKSKRYPRYLAAHEDFVRDAITNKNTHWKPYIEIRTPLGNIKYSSIRTHIINPNTDMIITYKNGKRKIMSKEEFDKIYTKSDMQTEEYHFKIGDKFKQNI